MVKRKLTENDILSLSNLYNRGLSSHVIAKKFNTYHSNILHHLKKLKIKRRDRSSAAKEGVKAGRIIIKKNKIPENLILNKDLAYILGVLAGDGYMDYSDKRRIYQIGLSATDKDFVNKFKKALFNFFKIKPTNEFRKSRKEKWNAQHITRLCSHEACDYINLIGKFKKENWIVPEIIKNSNNSIKCAFIKGFFDSEGEIDKQIGRVGATSMNLNGLTEIKNLLKNLGIRNTIIKKKDLRENASQKYILRIHDKNSIRLFNELISFTIQRKQRVLKEFLSKYDVKEATMFPRDRDRLTP
ncbi:MAG: LAGLIDADG family homing endonuclease [Nanoarchaeota archaeon]|nr:LAGLIDADG family homing endonuclease [Nanoarchaeota archaeon]